MENELKNWINVSKAYTNCPHCEKGLLNTRVKRGFLVKNVFVWMDVKRYQCNVCARKVYLKTDTSKHQSLSN
jgi:transposase-like protein